jgi:sugar phosphate isomerase/epimerase
MSASVISDLSKLCIHTITLKPWTIEQSARKFSEAGVAGITVWRDAITGMDIRETGKLLRSLNLKVVSLCRGGFFPALEKKDREAAIKENIKAIDEASELEAPMLVLVCGAAPGQSLIESREQIKLGIEACILQAEKKGVQLTIEPLHPMYAGDRSAINTLEQANDIAEYFSSPSVGIAADVYHLWWDPDLQNQLIRCGANGNLSAFHICDWKTPTLDMLNDRGLMGEGCINIREIRGWAEGAGFKGYNEVEIFSTIHWQEDQDIFFDRIIKAYLQFS